MKKFLVTLRSREPVSELPELDFGDLQVARRDEKLILNKTIESNSFDSVYEKGVEWGRLFSQALSLKCGLSITFEIEGYHQLEPPQERIIVGKTLSLMSSITITYPIKVEDLEQAIELTRRLTVLHHYDRLRRAVSWYEKGLRDQDLVDRFVDHWVALETLSNYYEGRVDPYVCPKCGHELNPRPHGGILREFLRLVGLENNIRELLKIQKVRGKLFHKGEYVNEAVSYQPKLQDVLNCSLLKILDKVTIPV